MESIGIYGIYSFSQVSMAIYGYLWQKQHFADVGYDSDSPHAHRIYWPEKRSISVE
jgi:hypothetical protein